MGVAVAWFKAYIDHLTEAKAMENTLLRMGDIIMWALRSIRGAHGLGIYRTSFKQEFALFALPFEEFHGWKFLEVPICLWLSYSR